MLCDVIKYILLLVLRLIHLKKQIFPVKSSHHGVRIVQSQSTYNVIPHRLSGSSCKGTYNRAFLQQINKLHNLSIAWAEILPPLGNAVSLVHSNHGNLNISGKADKALRGQSLRRNIYYLVQAHPRSTYSLEKCTVGQRTVDKSSRNSSFIQSLYLILHEGNQW